MAAPDHFKRMSTLMLMISVFATGLAAPATKAEPPTRTKGKPQPRTDRYGDPLPPGALARLGTVRLRPGNSVRLLTFLPDRKTFLSVAMQAEGMLVSVWRRTTGELLHRFQAPLLPVRGLALSPDGKTLVASGYNRAERKSRVLFWDIGSGKMTGELTGTDGGVLALAFSPDGKTLATAGEDQTLRLWDVATRSELRRFEDAKDRWRRLAFLSDGKKLTTVGQGHTVQIWDTTTGKLRKTVNLDPGAERAAAFSPDGKMLVTTGSDGKKIQLWDVAAGKVVLNIAAETATASLVFSPNGKMLATGDARQENKILTPSAIHLWDASTGRELHRLDGHLFGVSTLAFSPDGKQLLSGSVGGVLHLWDTATGKDLLPFAEHESYVNSIAFSPDGRVLATAGLDGAMRLWEPASGKPPRLFERKHQQRVWDVIFGPDGRTLASYGHDGSIRFWNTAEGRQTRERKVSEDRLHSTVAFSPDGRAFAVWQAQCPIVLFDAATGKEQRRLAVAAMNAGSLLYSPDGKSLASRSISVAADTGVLQLWDTTAGKELRNWTLSGIGPMAFSPNGQTIFSIAGGFSPPRMGQRTILSWDVATGANRSFQTVQQARVFSAAVSPNGRILAWGDTKGAITLWELAAGQVRRRLKGHHSYVETLAFSPDGKSLASASADTTALLWDVTGMPADPPSVPFRGERLQCCWGDLAGKDVAKAFDAIGLLTASPAQAVPLLKGKLHPAPQPAERRRIARLIAELDSDEFTVREKAKEQLRQLGERAEPGLREALKGKLPLEARKRIEELMEGLKALSVSPDRLRELRAVEALEHIGTAEARQVLRTLAEGAAHARLTHEAKASLRRLSKRSGDNAEGR